MNDLVLGIVTQLATVTAAVWGLTELVGQITKWNKGVLALIFGPVTGAVAWSLGFVPLITATGFKGYAAGAFGGLVATLTAKAFHDFIANPLIQGLRGKSGPPAA